MEFIGYAFCVILAGLFIWGLIRYTKIKEQLNAQNDKLEALQAQLAHKAQELSDAQSDINSLNIKLVESTTREKAFKQTQEQTKQEFQNLANKILKQTSIDFKEQSKEELKNLLNPLGTRIDDFTKEITGFKAINEGMKSETENLTKALTSNVKMQGNWGEFQLERILEESGLTEGLEYVVQGKNMEIKSADGRRQMPDVIINLPEQKHIVIDSKVSLTHYMNYQAAKDDAERKNATKDFITSTANHIKNLSGKDYHNAHNLKSLDFVMMFMPLEASYFLLMQEKEDMLGKAWDNRIAIVCTSTLLPTLRTIGYLWQLQKQNQNAEKIAHLGGAIYDKIHGFLDNMQGVGKALDNAQNKHHDALKQLSEGKGNVMGQAEKMKELGAKTHKSLPQLSDD